MDTLDSSLPLEDSLDQTRSSIGSEVPSKRRGRPPKKKLSAAEVLAPIAFVEEYLEKSVQSPPPAPAADSKALSEVNAAEVLRSSLKKTPASSKANKEVSFFADQDDDIPADAPFDHEPMEDEMVASTPAVSRKRGKSPVSSSKTPVSDKSMAISTPGSFDFPRGRMLKDESFVPAEEDDDDLQDTDEEDMNESFVPETSFNEVSNLDDSH